MYQCFINSDKSLLITDRFIQMWNRHPSALSACWQMTNGQIKIHRQASKHETLKPNVDLLLGHRLRRWPNSKPTLAARLMFAGIRAVRQMRLSYLNFAYYACVFVNLACSTEGIIYYSWNPELCLWMSAPISEIRIPIAIGISVIFLYEKC